MKVLMVSKPLIARAYRQKLTEMARLGVDITAVVPHGWREGSVLQALEPGPSDGYTLIPTDLRWNGHFHLHYYPELARIVDRARPDLIHMDEEPYNLATFLGARTARSRGRPSVFYTYQNICRRYPLPFSTMERAVYRWSSRALAASDEAGEVLRTKGYTGPLTVVPQFGVDPTVFRPLDRESNGFRIGFLNRLIPGKAPLLLLEAFSALPADATLSYIGDGPLRSDLETEVVSRHLQDRVSVTSRLPSADVPEVIAAMDVVVLPSLTTTSWKEQFGRILIEAMACGVPVVGSDSGEIPHVIGDGGLVVPEGDLDALGGALLRLYRDRELRRELGGRGRRRVLSHYTHEQVARRTVDAYCAVLS